MPEELLTVLEFAQMLRVDSTTVRRWIKAGALEVVRLPHAGMRQGYRVKRSTLDTILATGQVELRPVLVDARKSLQPAC